MALENPITSDDLTINFASLLDMSVSDRVQAAALDTGFAQALMASLTPIQMAKAFPDYYRKELPDISNFILANRYLDSSGKGAFDQQGGGDHGTAKPFYDGESSTNSGVKPALPKTIVDTILESAKIQETMGEQGVTSSLKDIDENKIVSTETVSMLPAERALLDTIAIGNPNKPGFWESPDYNTIVGQGGKFTDFSDHPRVFGTANSTAAGRYQFTKTTWDDVVARYNKQNPDKPITDFTPVNQDRAALFLARERYNANTGRDLDADLQNPPENMGDLIREGLGQGRKYMTWEIFTKRTSNEIGEAFNENLNRNTEFARQEAEAAAKNDKLDSIIVTPELQAELDKSPEAKKYFVDHPEMAKKLQKSINEGNLTVANIQKIVETPTETTSVLSKVEKQKFVSEKDPRQFYNANKAVDPDDEIWNHVHPDLARDRDRIYAGGGEIRTGAILAADAAFRYAANKGVPMRVAVEGGVDSHSTNHLKDGIGEALDIKPGTRDAKGRDVGSSNTWEEYKLDPLEIATIGAATIQSMGGTARIGVTNDAHGTHLQDTGNEGLGIHEQHGGMSWSYGGDPHGAEGGDFRNKLQSGYFGKQYAGLINSLYAPEEEKKDEITTESAVVAGNTLFVGDSIAQGLKDAAKGEGNTKVGRSPSEVLSEMETMGAESFKGKKVVLSTGLSNNTADLESVRKQMEFLKNAGANVQIAGMSNSREDLSPGNQQLQSMAGEYGYQFMGGFDAGEDKIHPTSYSEYAAAAEPKQTDEVTQTTEAPATPVATAEQAKPVETATATPVGPVGGPEEAPKFRTGGSPDVQDDENLSVFDEDGSLKWKMNSGEGIYVKPKDTEYADDKMDELSGRIDELDDKMGSPPPEKNQPKTAPDKAGARPDKNWQQDASTVTYSLGSQNRAFKRTKFQNEGFHFNRSAPNSISS